MTGADARRSIVAVVDDDASVRKALARLLKSAGFDALIFSSATAFLQDSRRKDVACLVLDVSMPGMDGPALQTRLAETDATLPTIFMTATKDRLSEAQALAGGALAFLHKPFENETLLEAVHHAVNVPNRPE